HRGGQGRVSGSPQTRASEGAEPWVICPISSVKPCASKYSLTTSRPFLFSPSRRTPMCEPAILFYCQHVLGMGHLVRSLALARALAARFRVVFLNGGRVPRGLPRPAGVEFVDLPPLGFDAMERLVSQDSRRPLERAQRERRETILRPLPPV